MHGIVHTRHAGAIFSRKVKAKVLFVVAGLGHDGIGVDDVTVGETATVGEAVAVRIDVTGAGRGGRVHLGEVVRAI